MSSRAVANVVALIMLALLAYRHFGGALPGPIPGPAPPPMPIVDPIDGDGFRVLIAYESAELATYPRQQLDALYSTEIRGYLNSKCATGERSTPDYRILDVEADMSNDSEWWKKAMQRQKASLPWIVIDSKQGGFEGPLPATVEATMELLRKYGG